MELALAVRALLLDSQSHFYAIFFPPFMKETSDCSYNGNLVVLFHASDWIPGIPVFPLVTDVLLSISFESLASVQRRRLFSKGYSMLSSLNSNTAYLILLRVRYPYSLAPFQSFVEFVDRESGAKSAYWPVTGSPKSVYWLEGNIRFWCFFQDRVDTNTFNLLDSHVLGNQGQWVEL